jgi:hypothetical protein
MIFKKVRLRDLMSVRNKSPSHKSPIHQMIFKTEYMMMTSTAWAMMVA